MKPLLILALPGLLAAALGAQPSAVLLRDIVPSYNGSSPLFFANLRGIPHFAAAGGIWRTDGTPQGTMLAVDPAVIGMQMNHEDMVTAGDHLWFTAWNGTIGSEPMISDGTNAGTRVVSDLVPGPGSSSPRFFTDLGDGRVAFLADTNTYSGWSLVISNGTAGGTKPVAPAANPSPGTHRVAVLGNLVFFTGRDPQTGNELWVYDLTTDSARLVKDIWPGTQHSNPWIAGVAHDRVWLHAQVGVGGYQVLTSDGTTAGTNPISTSASIRFDINDDLSTQPFAPTATKVFISSYVQPSRTLWVWDRATGAVTQLGAAWMLCPLDPICLFATTTGLWRSDGTAAGTVRIHTTVPQIRGMRRVGARHAFYIAADPVTQKTDLWRTDGTAAGTARHVEVNQSRNGFTGLRLYLLAVNGGVFWNANHELYGDEPTWVQHDGGNSQEIGTSCGQPGTRISAGDPVLGQNLTVFGTGAFSSAACGVVLMAPTYPPVPFGPRCFLYGDPSIVIPLSVFTVTNPTWTLSFGVPNDPALSGARAVLQAIYGGGSTPGGWVTTNGVLLTAGR